MTTSGQHIPTHTGNAAMTYNVYTVEFINAQGELCKRYHMTWEDARNQEIELGNNGANVLTNTTEQTKPTKMEV